MPNPELAKILPAVNRTAMEHFRTTYGISVTQVRAGPARVSGCRGQRSVVGSKVNIVRGLKLNGDVMVVGGE